MKEVFTLVVENILDLIGNTPVLKSHEKNNNTVYSKLEFFNPGGSQKDRPALKMIEDAENKKIISPGATIIESSSGNMAIGLAYICKVKGYKLIIVTRPNISPSNEKIIKALGGKVIKVDKPSPVGGWQQARINRVKELLSEIPNSYYPCQYDNPSNPSAYSKLGMELMEQIPENPDILIGAVGSGGSLSGTARFLKKYFKNLKVIAVDDAESAIFKEGTGISHLTGLGSGIQPKNVDENIIDKVIHVKDIDAFIEARNLLEEKGLFVGGSGGAVFRALKTVLEEENNKIIYCIYADSGERYLETVYSDAYWRKYNINKEQYNG